MNKFKNLVSKSLNSAEAGALIAVIVLSLLLSLVSPQFLNIQNLTFVARGFSFIAIASLGAALVIITGGIDLSVGSIMGLAGVVSAFLSSHNSGTFLALMGGIFVGVIVGFINGVLVAKAKLAPFIVTLGMLSICRGLVYVVSGGWPMQGLTDSILFLGQGFFLGIPMPVIIMLLFLVMMQVVLRHSSFGWYIYSIGGNEDATRLSGISVDKIKILVYVISGTMAAISGVLLTARLGVGETTAGNGYELNVIAALVLGGVSLTGGKGSAISALFGAALMGILRNGLVLLGVSSFWQQIVIGVVIILAVLLDQIRLTHSSKS